MQIAKGRCSVIGEGVGLALVWGGGLSVGEDPTAEESGPRQARLLQTR